MDKVHTVQGWIQQRSGGLDPHTPPPPKPRIYNVHVESGKKKDIEFDLVRTPLNFHLPPSPPETILDLTQLSAIEKLKL